MLSLEQRASLAWPGSIGANVCVVSLVLHVLVYRPREIDLFSAIAFALFVVSSVLCFVGTKARIDVEVENRRR